MLFDVYCERSWPNQPSILSSLSVVQSNTVSFGMDAVMAITVPAKNCRFCLVTFGKKVEPKLEAFRLTTDGRSLKQ